MFDAYHKWLGIPPEEQPPDHYRLLGIGRFESDSEVIAAAADRQMAYLRTFQAGSQAEVSQRLLNEVARARLCLLDPVRKAAYDAELRAVVPRPRAPAVSPWMEHASQSPAIGPLGVTWTPKASAPRPAAARRRQDLALRRLVTVVSAALAAMACAWLLARYAGVFNRQEVARQTDPAGKGAAAAKSPAVPAAPPRPSAAPAVPAATTAAAPGHPLPARTVPAKPQAAAAPRQTPPLPQAPLPGPFVFPPAKPADAAPANAGPSSAGDWPRPVPELPPPRPKEDAEPAAPEQPKPKVSALAPPGTMPAEPKPDTPAAAASPDATELFENGMGLVAQGRYPVGYRKLLDALKADRNRFEVLFALGLLEAVVAHEWDDAEKHFNQCAKLQPKSLAVLNNLALVRLRTNKAGLALRHWDAVLAAGSPPPDQVVQNIARTCLLASNRRLILSPEHSRALDLLARKVDVAARANRMPAFHYMLPDGEAGKNFRWPDPPGLAEDWCMFCLGYGTVKCPACVRGAVRSSATRVLGADRDTGTVVTQTGTVRSRCTRCGGTGWVDCRACARGHQH